MNQEAIELLEKAKKALHYQSTGFDYIEQTIALLKQQPAAGDFTKEAKKVASNIKEESRSTESIYVCNYLEEACDRLDRAASTNKDLESEINRLRKTLYHECPDKYPDNCEICKGTNLGVRGNENIIDGKVMCDYCHAAKAKKEGK